MTDDTTRSLPDTPAPAPLDAATEQSAESGRRPGIRGFGYLYRRGRFWWIRYSHRGRDFRESSKSEREIDAERLLKKRWKQIGRGRFVGPAEERVRVSDLFDALERDYTNNGRRSISTLKGRLKPLRAFFGLDRAVDVTAEAVERYKAARLADHGREDEEKHVAPATINRELAALRRAFRLAVEQERLTSVPTIKLLAENNARQGFLEPVDFDAVAKRLPDDLQDFARFAYVTGWRKGEIQTLAWTDVDRAGGRIRLRREHSKTGEPRVLALVGELAELIERRWTAREYRPPDGTTALSSFVFHRHGRPVGDFRKAWAAACEAAGVAGVIFHDLRRSAIRNLERAGVSQAVAMKISGHRTASVYRRYRIVGEDDIREALARTQAAMGRETARTVTPIRAARETGR